MWFKYLHRQAGICIYRSGTAHQLWPSMHRVSPQLWHPIPEELGRSWKMVSEGDSTKTSAWCCRSDQTWSLERESLVCLLECHMLVGCSDCHQAMGKDKPREVMIFQQPVAEQGLGPFSTSKHRTGYWPRKGLHTADDCLCADWFHSVLPFEGQVLPWEQERSITPDPTTGVDFGSGKDM